MTASGRIPPYPDRITAGTAVARVLDGLAFRFHWATEGLMEAEYGFRPGPDSMSIGELVAHVWGLANWVGASVFGTAPRPAAYVDRRESALWILQRLRDAFAEMDEAGLRALRIDEGRPFWNMLNGPIADALTHTGQISAFRRLAGNPAPEANVFLGTPPD